MIVRSKIERGKHDFWREYASHCPFSLSTFKFLLLDHLVEYLEKFESLFFTDATPFEHFNLLIKQPYNISSR